MLLLIGRADPHAYEDTSLLSSFCPAGSQATTAFRWTVFTAAT